MKHEAVECPVIGIQVWLSQRGECVSWPGDIHKDACCDQLTEDPNYITGQ